MRHTLPLLVVVVLAVLVAATAPRGRPRLLRVDAVGAQLVAQAVRRGEVAVSLCSHPVVEHRLNDVLAKRT